MKYPRPLLPLVCLAVFVPHLAADGNRLAYLDSGDPYYPSRTVPKLVTPQWVGDRDVEAAVILGIDDMRGSEKWERFLRPILERLKKIDGRAPVSIMTCTVDAKDPHLQKWLKEGLSLETHTIDHPCPLLGKGGMGAARSTYERCVDLLSSVPGNRPVAFRVPCCDSLNTPSPRFFAEVFNRTTAKGHFLSADSSVFNLSTPDDPELPRELVFDSAGRERFRKYLPSASPFGNYICDYPYPYVLGGLCWEFPCATPSDWQGQNRHGSVSPLTLADMKASLDAAVRKQGVYCLVFHPHGWMSSAQVIDLIDHAVAKYGKKVQFLTFKEAHERLVKNLLAGQPLRSADGQDNGVRLLDIDGDGYMDVVIGNRLTQTRRWEAKARKWVVSEFPVHLVSAEKAQPRDAGVRFGVLRPDGKASFIVRNETAAGVWSFDADRWSMEEPGLDGLPHGKATEQSFFTAHSGKDRGVRLRDVDGDGVCELIVGNDTQNAVYGWASKGWKKLPFALPEGARVVGADGRDAGLRFIDVDEDGREDVLSSNDDRYSLHLFESKEKGWAHRVLAGKRGGADELPPIVRQGGNYGMWAHSRQLWWQNEHTAQRPGLVERRPFNDLLASVIPQGKSPQASLRCLHPRPGFTAELMAAEPLVMDPIAFAWGPDGKLWVVEMGDYPLGVDGKGKPGGRVLYLEDTDGDGKYDRRTVFLDNLGFPTGVLPWRKGVLVTCAPDIFYAEDTDGDGKADRRTVLYTGFHPGNQQHRVNTLAWGLDNWIHVANGDSGGRVRSVKTGKVVNISGRDLRIRPDTGDIDATTGQTQYGRSRDDYDNWFGGNNSVPMRHYVLADHYLRRNPHFAAAEVRPQVPEVPGAAPVFPLSRILPRFNDPGAAGRFTSACSPIVYRDELFGPRYSGSLFVSEPVHNLVHREVITPAGVTFRGSRAVDEQTSEFLASTDHWFRPTMIQTGPDGALWVADMYRAVIEHPEWISRQDQKKLDLRAGHDMGRLYRVFPVGKQPRKIPRLDKLDAAELAAALDSPSGWQRDVAHRMLLWREDGDCVLELEKVLRSPRALARLHALCVLDGKKALKPKHLIAALSDADAGVRRHAVRLCEGRLTEETLAAALVKRVEDEDAPVRLQLACTLGEWKDERAGKALGRLLRKDGGDRFIHAAAMSSLTPDNLPAVLSGVLGGEPPVGLIESLMRQSAAMGVESATVTLLEQIASVPAGEKPGWRLDVLAAFLDGLASRSSSLGRLAKDGSKPMKAAVAGVSRLFTAARAGAVDDKLDEPERIRCVGVLGRGADGQKEDLELLGGLLEPRVPAGVQSAAVASLARAGHASVPALLLRGWKSHGPALRAQVLAALLQRPAWVVALLDAIAKKQVLALDLDAAARQRLLEHRDAEVRKRAARVLEGTIAADRQKVIDSYLPALKRSGDAEKGKAVFARTCSACHKLDGVGNEVGPDLAALASKSGEYMLTAILDPNRAVEARYLSYQADTVEGRVFTGVLTAETGASITLVNNEGKPQTILRRNLERLTSTGKSLMPEGVEKDVAVEAMADLLAYLRSRQPAVKPKAFPGNRPEVVRADANGALKLTAQNAEIYGPSLVLEKQYGNLGYWCDVTDRAVWTVEVGRTGKYDVWADHACDDSGAGNTFVLEADEVLLKAKVESTGSWDNYRDTKFGQVTLPAGAVRLTMRSQGKIRAAMIDLRSLRLVPAKAGAK